jgi:hypothetical protein
MSRVSPWLRFSGVVLVLAAQAAPAATLVSYPDDRATFAARDGVSAIGNFPTAGPTSSLTVGGVTFVTDSGSLFFGNFSTRVPNNEMIISAEESFHANLPGGIFAFGFDLYEPNFSGPSGCNTAVCVDDNFSIQIFAGTTSLGSFTYNAPDDNGTSPVVSLGFFGVCSSVAFNRVVVRDVTGNLDNEMFANFLTGTLPTPALGTSWGRLKIMYR